MQALLDQQQHGSKAPGTMESEESSEVRLAACRRIATRWLGFLSSISP
jgi:hypothetical protein